MEKHHQTIWAIFTGFIRPHTDLQYDKNIAKAVPTGRYLKSSLGRFTANNPMSEIEWADDSWMNDIEQTVDFYAKSVFTVDTYVGEILKTLRDTGQDDSTLVILFSDHGVTLNDGFDHFSKWTLYDETLHVPLILRVPKVFTGFDTFRKRTMSNLVELVDVFSTIIEYANITRSYEGMSKLDGESLFSENSIKNHAVATLGYCEKRLRQTKIRTKPCTTRRQGRGPWNWCCWVHHQEFNK